MSDGPTRLRRCMTTVCNCAFALLLIFDPVFLASRVFLRVLYAMLLGEIEVISRVEPFDRVLK